VSITGPTNQSLFTFDGVGRMVQIIEKTNGVAMSTNRFVWDNAELCEQRNISGVATKRFFDDGEQISSTNYYFTFDHIQSVREMIDSSGTIQARYDYDAYGRRTKTSGSLDADFGYTADYYHSVSGLYLTLCRAYDTDLSRWLSRDPLGDPLRSLLSPEMRLSNLPVVDAEMIYGSSLYTYVLNDPLNNLDQLGYASFWSALGHCAAQHYGFGGDGPGGGSTVARAAVAAGMTPLYKPWIGEQVMGNASKFTNPISYLGHELFPKFPKAPFRAFGTNRWFGLAGRANFVVGLAFLTYDISSIAGCVAGTPLD
jgi:RHS repeat-associated protein